MPTALDVATELLGREGKPAYVKFDTISKELPKRSREEGHYVAVDVDIVTVRQIGATDSVIFEVDRWFKQNDVEVQAGRLSLTHAQQYRRAYEAWKAGQEMPLEGTPIKGWAVISPAQAETIIRAGVRTVEDLASMNAEAMGKIGMGAVMLKNKAQAWVAQAKDKGPLTMEMAELKTKNEVLELTLTKLQEQMAVLQQEAKSRPVPKRQEFEREVLTEEDMVETLAPARRPSRKKEPA